MWRMPFFVFLGCPIPFILALLFHMLLGSSILFLMNMNVKLVKGCTCHIDLPSNVSQWLLILGMGGVGPAGQLLGNG